MTLIEDFESGSLSSEWTTNTSNAGITSNKSYEGSYSFNINDSSCPEFPAVYAPSELSGGVDVDSVSFYWREESGSYGGAIQILDSNGNRLAGFASDNPQWDVLDDTGGYTSTGESGQNYSDWTKVKISFDYTNNNITYDISDTASTNSASVTYSCPNTLDSSVGVEKFQFADYQSGTLTSSSSYIMSYDNFSSNGLNTPSQYLDSVSNVDFNSADFEATFSNDGSVSTIDAGFEIFDSTGSLVETLNTGSFSVSGNDKTFSDSTSNLSDSSVYDVRSFAVDGNSNRYESSKVTLETFGTSKSTLTNFSAETIDDTDTSTNTTLSFSAETIDDTNKSANTEAVIGGGSVIIPEVFGELQIRPIDSESKEVIDSAKRIVSIGGISVTETFPDDGETEYVSIYVYNQDIEELLIFVEDSAGRIIPYSALLNPPLRPSDTDGIKDIEFTRTVELFTGRIPSGLSDSLEPKR